MLLSNADGRILLIEFLVKLFKGAVSFGRDEYCIVDRRAVGKCSPAVGFALSWRMMAPLKSVAPIVLSKR